MNPSKPPPDFETPSAPLLRSLRAAILSSSLAKGPCALSGSIRLHVVFSTPKSAKQLYPLAYVSSARARSSTGGNDTHLDAEHQRLEEIKRGIVKDAMVDAWEEQIFVTATWIPKTESTWATPSSTVIQDASQISGSGLEATQDNKTRAEPSMNTSGDPVEGPRMIYALESYLYTLPKEQSALLYVSKLDTTGFGPQPEKTFKQPGNERLREYLEIIKLQESSGKGDESKKKHDASDTISSRLTTSSPTEKSNRSTYFSNSSPSNTPSKPSIVRSSSFTGLKDDSMQSTTKYTKPSSTAASSLYTTSKSSLTTLITHAFLHHFSSLTHWSPPPNQYLEVNSSPPPLPRISSSFIVPHSDPNTNSISNSKASNSSSGKSTRLTTSSINMNTMPIKHLSLHILARSQATYLFPGSPENKYKRVLSDTGLIKWWKKVLEGVIRHIKVEADELNKFKGEWLEDVRAKEAKMIPALPRDNSSISSVSASSNPAPTSEAPVSSLSIAPTAAVNPSSTSVSTSIPQNVTTSSSSPDGFRRSSQMIKESSTIPGILTNPSMDIRPYYMIPGYSKLESHPLVPINNSSVNDIEWTYGHPYSREGEDSAPLPLHLPESGSGKSGKEDGNNYSIATLIPHFPDDPKSRFLDELARDAHEHAGNYDDKKAKDRDGQAEDRRSGEESGRKRQKLEEGRKEFKNEGTGASTSKSNQDVPTSVAVASSASESTSSPPAIEDSISTQVNNNNNARIITSQQKHLSRERSALDQVSPNEFWERMGFRQECCSGNVVGAFVVGFTSRDENSTRSEILNSALTSRSPDFRPLANQQGSSRLVTSSSSSSFSANNNSNLTNSSTASTAPRARPLNLPNPTLPDLILKHLLRDSCDWSNLGSAVQLTLSWERGLKKAVLHRGGLSSSSTMSTPTPTSLPATTTATVGNHLKQASSEEDRLKNLAKGILWADLDLDGPAVPEQLEKAMKLWKAEHEQEFGSVMEARDQWAQEFNNRAAGESSEQKGSRNVNASNAGATAGAGAGGVAKVNTLSVKRKRKT